jgi:hypothetical protein
MTRLLEKPISIFGHPTEILPPNSEMLNTRWKRANDDVPQLIDSHFRFCLSSHSYNSGVA